MMAVAIGVEMVRSEKFVLSIPQKTSLLKFHVSCQKMEFG
jgi:hypothetical protein